MKAILLNLIIGFVLINTGFSQEKTDTTKSISDTVETEEIEVFTDKPNVEFSGEKLIYNVSKDPTTKGETIIDVLKKTPLLSVDQDNNVSIRGNNGIKILVDGRESKSFTQLDKLPAELLEKVEVITNPSAKYQSEGVAGIINLVLKEQDIFGTNGNVSVNVGTSDRYNGGINFNLKKNKFSNVTNLFTGQWYGKGGSTIARENFFYDSLKYINSKADNSNRSKWLYFAPSLDYTFEKGTYLELFGDYVMSNWTFNYDALTKNTNSLNQLVNELNVANRTEGKWRSMNLGLFFNRKFDEKGQELNIQGSFNKPLNNQDTRSNRFYTDAQGNMTTPNPYTFYDKREFSSDNINFSADYTLPLDDVNKLETGYKGTIEMETNELISDSLNYTTGNYERNNALSNKFKYDKNIQAGYVVYNTKLADFVIKGGVRVENSSITGDLVSTGEKFNQNYTDIFPTLNISRKLGITEELKFSYGRRINRPFSWYLNPFENRNAPQSIFKGNPNLQPEYTNNFEIGFMKFFGTFSITPTVFYRNKTNAISTFVTMIDSVTTFITYENIGSVKDYGIDFILGGRPFDWLTLNGTLSYYRSEYDNSSINQNLVDGNLWKGNLNSTITLPDAYNFSLNYFYQGDAVTAQGTTKGSHIVGAGLRKSFFENSLTLNLNVNDIFDQSGFKQVTNGTTFRSDFSGFHGQRSINFSISYMFGKMEQENKPRRKNEPTTQQPPQGQ